MQLFITVHYCGRHSKNLILQNVKNYFPTSEGRLLSATWHEFVSVSGKMDYLKQAKVSRQLVDVVLASGLLIVHCIGFENRQRSYVSIRVKANERA